MLSDSRPYLHLRQVLTDSDLSYLREACKLHIYATGIPCYALVGNLDSPTCQKIQGLIEERLGETLYYLNDFYLYTDASFKTNWHMDTELFTFSRAINAWILLSPSLVDDPLGFIDRINDAPDRQFHSIKVQGDHCRFGNYFTGATFSKTLAAVEAEAIHTPLIEMGDILLLNPGRFHKTNTQTAKHAIALKFLLRGREGFLSTQQVDPTFWPEVAVLSDLVRRSGNWNQVIKEIQRALSNEESRKSLSAGFYPEKFDLYRRMVATL